MTATLESARKLVNNLHEDIAQYREMPGDVPQRTAYATQIVQKGNNVVETIRQAQQELASQLDALDAIEQEVSTQLNPRIGEVYWDASERMVEGEGDLNAAFDNFCRGLRLAMLDAPAVLRRPRLTHLIPINSLRSTHTANAILIVGILFALASSRLQVIPHGAPLLGFLVGTILVIIVKAIGSDGRRGHDGHAPSMGGPTP